MKYSTYFLVKTYILFHTANLGSAWQYFTALGEIKIHNSELEPRLIHSEYFFGHCADKTNIFYTHIHLNHMDVLGKVIIRGWIDVIRIPKCILLRAMAYDVDLIRSSTYRFQLCVPRITYCHTHHRFKYYYYELYVPDDMLGGMDWEIYFYGAPSKTWT